MDLCIKFKDGKVANIKSLDLENTLMFIKHAKLGKEINKEFTLVTSEGENIKTNHDQIASVEVVF